jgi:hypothetical protein
MNLYLDDDSVDHTLVQLLRRAGHDVELPLDVGLSGEDDPVHLRHAIHVGRVLLSANHKDFELLHDLIDEAGGHHPGIMIVRKDNNPNRDLRPAGIVRAIAKLLVTGNTIADEYIILNHWR